MVFLKRLNLFTTILFTPFVILCLFLNNKKFFKAPLICSLLLLITSLQLSAQICGTSGFDGPQNALPPINTYFPLASNTTLNAGTKSIMLQAVPPNDPNYNLSYGVTEIKPGDLILIIQMQDATFNYNDSDLYGSGSATSGLDNLGGTGYISIGNSGKYEYVVATSFVPLTGGLLTFRGAGAGKGAVNTYVNQNFTATRGQRRFQIVRVPQYSTLVLSSNLTTPPYNGSVGGIIAFDVAGTMKFNGFSVDASERGFRGGYGPVAGSGANTNNVYAVASSSTRSVGKGEGIAGTPRYMWDGFNQVDNLVEGLPGGSYGRGAPANAGGAGNDHNAGGGGGSNGGYGGIGGRGWQGAGGNLNPLTGGGRPGFILPADMARLIMGGGGGGGDANNATSGVKGGVGGGIILINVEKIDGFGLILSNGGVGQAGAFGSAPDGAGGGGAGGSIFVRSLAPSATANLVIEAKGGNGGNTKNDNNNAHGPGGGGGGGLIFTQVPSAIISTDIIKGLSGKSNNGASISHGAEDGTNGSSQNFITSQLPIHLQGGGSICYPSLNVTLSELNAGPGGIRNAGTTATYKLRVYNNVSGGNAGDVKVDFELPYGFTLSNVTQTLTGDAVNTGTFGFTPGATGVMNFGSYNISPGDYVEFTISINIANNVPSGIYHASAQATYLDPTRTNANPSRKITANSQAFNGYNTTYETGGLGGLPVSGTNYNGNLLVSSQEDVYINAAIIASDCDAIVDGSFNSAPVGEYDSPNYLNKWKVVNNGDKVKIVNDGTLKGALIRNNGADKFSLKQTVNGIKALSFYTITFDYRNWQGASCSNAASKLIVQILDSTTNNLIILSPEFNSTASPQVATISFTTLTNTKSLIIKVYDPGSPNPACGAFVDNFSITSPLSIQFSTQNIACFGLNTGKLIITSLNGAAGPYKLSYSANGGTNYSAIMNTGIITNSSPYEISNLLAGNYLLKIVDENGCTNIKQFEIKEPLQLNLTGSNTSILCNGAYSTVTLTANGGVSPYNYSIDGVNYVSQNTFPDLTAGSYTFTVKDVNNCLKTTFISIGEPSLITLSANLTPIKCFGETASVSLTVSGGTGAYNYSIDGISFQLSNVFLGVLQGPQIFRVRDANNCIKTVAVDVIEPALLTLSSAKTDILCYGGTSTVTLSAAGGTGTYLYSKDGGATFSAGNTFSGLIAGNYSFIVKDANACVTTISVSISEPALLTLSAAKTDILCYGGTSTVTLSAAGGAVTYQYSKDGGATFSAGNTFSGLIAGNYSFIVKDANACATTISVSISEPALLTLSAAKTDILCYGGTSTVTLSAAGGAVTYQYSKDGGATFSASNSFGNLVAGNYSFIVKDANACATTIAVSITEPSLLTLFSTKTDILCYGGTSTVTLSAGGGTGAYQYSKDGGATFSASNSFGNLVAGNYSFIVKDANACATTIAVSISEPSLLTLSATKTDILCYGATSTVTLSANGGTGAYQYSKDGGSTFQAANTFSGLIAGNYSFIVKDANACATTISVSITEPSLLTLSATKTDILCYGATSTVTLSANGGTGAYQYSKDGGSTFQAANTFSGLIAGNYSFIVKDANACATTISVSITEPALLTLSAIKTDILCYGGTSTVTLSAGGGTGVYQYSKDGITFQDGITFSGLIAGNYFFIVKDANSCATTIAVSITEPALLTLSSTKTDILCYGGTSTVTISAGGGTGVYQYSKDGITFQDGITFSGLIAGNYSFIVKDANACATTIAVSITEPDQLTLSSTKTDILCYGGTSTVTLSAGGGTGAYQYSKDGGVTFQVGNTFSSLIAGTYSFIVKDANSCATTIAVSISEPDQLTLSAAKTDILCFGETSTVTLSANGGTGAYQYSKDGGVTFSASNSFGNLVAGTYSFIVKDANACATTIAVSITEPDQLTLSSTKTDILCYGATSTVTLSANGGTGAYQYSKDGGTTFSAGNTFSGLIAGNYSFIVKDANACTTTIAVSITEPALLTLSSTKTDILCYGGTSTVTLSAGGGTGAYQYSKDGGVTFQVGNTFSSLIAGTYSFIVKDANSCATTIAVSISEPDQLTLSAAKTDILCFGETSTVTLSANGGTGAYQYSKDGGVTFSASNSFGNLVAGTYSFIVKDANACATTIAVSITEPDQLTLSSTKTDILCYGATSTVTLSANGGTGAYQYSKDGGTTFSAGNTFSGLIAGNYSFIVKDANACTTTIAVSITEPALLTLSSTKTDILCYGGTSTVTLSTGGGTGSYQYSKDGGVTFSSSDTFGNLVAGNYSFIVKDANACATTIVVSITEPSLLTLSSSNTDILCYGGTSNVTLSAGGGTGAYQYSKDDGTTFQTTNTFSGLTAGNYFFIVKDANACATTIAVSITEPSLLTLSSTKTDILCYGGTSNVTISAGGGTGTYQYSKDGGTTFQAANTFSGLTAGNYSFIVKDANACATTIAISISEPALLTLSSTKTDILCNGGTSIVTLSAGGGTGVYQFSKDGGATFQTTNTFSGLVAGTYSFIVKDTNNCTSTLSTNISEPIELTLSANKTSILCSGGTSKVTLIVAGGTGTYLYSKDGVTFQAENTFSGLIAGNYRFTAKDVNACATTIAVSIIEPASLTLTSSKTDILCKGGTSTVTLSEGGGTGAYQYSKDGGATFQAANTFSGLSAGNYSFIIKDANACATSIAISITEPSFLTLTSSKTDILCQGETSTVTLSAGGGTGVYQYSKDGGVTFSASNSFSNLVAGNYSFIVKDANACSVSINVVITEPATLSITENHIDVLCFGSNTGKINLNITGGYAPYIYLWSNGNGTKDLDNLIAGVYTVLVTDANNCSISKSITISSPASPLSIKETHQNNICFGDVNGKINITISGGTAPYSHIWSNGAKSKDLSGLSSGTYELLVTDKNNCNATIRVSITPLVKFSINEQLKQVSCFGEKNGEITLELTGGEAPYDIKWSNKLTGKKIENLAAGSYTYIAKDALGCEIAGVVKITEPLPISSQITVKNSTCKFSPDGAILIEVKGGTAPYQFYWNGFDRGANNSLLNIAPGKYTVNIIDANNCSKQIITEVLPGNCAPNANDDAYTTNEDTPITILTPGIIINDLDPDDDDLIISLASAKDPNMQNGITTGSNTSFKTKNGFVTLNQNGSFTYTPNKNFYGVENFIYKVTDGALNSNLAIVTIRVNAVNDPPIAQNDFYTTLEDVPVNGSVAPNDSDPENEPLSFTLVVPPARGTLVFKADGTFIYTPEKDFNGVITFNYQVCDPQGLCDQAVATITITLVNDPPIAVDDQFYLQRNLQISASVAPNDSEPDGDPTTFTLLTQPKNGTLVFNANGTFTYQPNNGFKGTDAFNYRICDPFGLCDNAVVDLIIQPLVTVKLTPANGIINEGENINITAELTESIFQDVTITIQFNGSAINDTDYKLTGNYQQITISAGQTTTTQKFNIAALLDDTRDDNEHVIASISSTSSPAFVNIGTGSEVIIKDIYPESIPSLPTENPDINPDPLTSPNGDGNGNDSFIIYNINNYPNNEVIIFNRWGNEVYRTKNYNNKENSFRGMANVGILTNSNKELVDGVYYYIIYTTQNGDKKMNKGYLILKR